MDGLGVLVGAAEVEAEGASAFVFAVDDDEVVGLEYRRDGDVWVIRRLSP